MKVYDFCYIKDAKWQSFLVLGLEFFSPECANGQTYAHSSGENKGIHKY